MFMKTRCRNSFEKKWEKVWKKKRAKRLPFPGSSKGPKTIDSICCQCIHNNKLDLGVTIRKANNRWKTKKRLDKNGPRDVTRIKGIKGFVEKGLLIKENSPLV